MNIKALAKKTHDSAPYLAHLNSSKKNQVLKAMARQLKSSYKLIMRENTRDIKNAYNKELSSAMIDRLLLDKKRIDEMANGLLNVAKLPDPVGGVIKKWKRPNGLEIQKVRIPLGVIGVIYESRPNVTVDAAGLCFKSGNAVILRGGSEAFYSNQILGKILKSVLKKSLVPQDVITVIPTTDRKVMIDMLKLSELIDVMIPRGGEGLMKFVATHSKIPVIKHDKGVCNLYVDDSASLAMAIKLIHNSKVQRPGVCNALENLFIHQKIAKQLLPLIYKDLTASHVELRGDSQTKKILPKIKKATEADWSTEYLDLILSVRLVKNMDEAISLIRRYGSNHTEAIVTKNKKNAQKFTRELDSSCVMVNASTRFNDGGQLGLGAEIGISTTKLHAFGPMGLEELTTSKFVVLGQGQIRK